MRNFNPGRVQPGLKVCTIDKRGELLHEDSRPGSNADMPPKVHFYSPVWSRESVRAKFASAVLFKPGARYAQKYVCTIFSARVDFNPPLGGMISTLPLKGRVEINLGRNLNPCQAQCVM